MLKIARQLLVTLLLVPLMACAATEEPYKEGEHYVELPKPVATQDDSKIEVVELFWYGCPHCYVLEPSVERWKAELPADVQFVNMPAVLNKTWEIHARAFYAAQMLGVLDKTHAALFDAIHVQRESLFKPETLAAFYEQHGVEQTEFNKAYKSFPVSGQISRAKTAQLGYQASGVPAFIVNGKYRVSTTMKAGTEGLFDVIDYLIAKERIAN